jgi:hypothetical protein
MAGTEPPPPGSEDGTGLTVGDVVGFTFLAWKEVPGGLGRDPAEDVARLMDEPPAKLVIGVPREAYSAVEDLGPQDFESLRTDHWGSVLVFFARLGNDGHPHSGACSSYAHRPTSMIDRPSEVRAELQAVQGGIRRQEAPSELRETVRSVVRRSVPFWAWRATPCEP